MVGLSNKFVWLQLAEAMRIPAWSRFKRAAVVGDDGPVSMLAGGIAGWAGEALTGAELFSRPLFAMVGSLASGASRAVSGSLLGFSALSFVGPAVMRFARSGSAGGTGGRRSGWFLFAGVGVFFDSSIKLFKLLNTGEASKGCVSHVEGSTKEPEADRPEQPQAR